MLLVLGPASCGNDDGSVAPGRKAELAVSFDPNPVAHVRPGEWEHLVYVTEAGGIGVYIYGFKIQDFSAAGVEYVSTSEDAASFNSKFRLCGGDGTFMAGGTTRCAAVIRTEGRNTGHSLWTFFGLDELGNEVTATGRVDFL